MSLHDWLCQVALVQGDTATLEKEESFLRGTPYWDMVLSARHGDMAASRGQTQKAQQAYAAARQLAQRLQIKESEAGALEAEGWMHAIYGNRKQAVASASAALPLSGSYNSQLLAATDLAFAGETRKALDIAAAVARKRPEDTTVQSISVPVVQAAAALSEGNGAKSIELLKLASPYDKIATQVQYVRALSFLQTKQADEAIHEFQRLLAIRTFAPSDPVISMAHLGLGRAYSLSGDSAKSRAAYQDFLALWKDADPDIPVLKQAKAEYAKLQ